jgi:glyoxylase-like metal-dependent hydrolase (beta-lactamase superfamily II)/rhodanese-related sulfurtransferase
MLLLQFFIPKLAHSSYILAGDSTCAVIDPRRDVDVYLEAARSLELSITHVIMTHLHADFVAGHMDLADSTGASIYAPRLGQCSFDHVAVAEGDEIVLEDMVLKTIETPGHTPEHVSYIVTDTSRGSEPIGVFCGDTLFVGDVGRPDLVPGRADELARKLYACLHDKLMNLPDFCEIYPLHAAGSLCGKAMAAKRRSTIGYERLYNDALHVPNVDHFVVALTENMPSAPDHFGRSTVTNTKGPALVSSLPYPRPMSPLQFQAASKHERSVVLDARPYEAFGAQHVRGSYSIDLETNFPTFAGWVVPPDKDILLVANTPEDINEAVTWLRRVGHDNTVAYLDGGMPAWAMAGLPTGHVPEISAIDLHRMLAEEPDVVVLDVRSAGEFQDGHIDRAINIEVAQLRTRHVELDKDEKTVLVCRGGNRAMLGASLLKQHGFHHLVNLAGGMTGYEAAGFFPPA